MISLIEIFFSTCCQGANDDALTCNYMSMCTFPVYLGVNAYKLQDAHCVDLSQPFVIDLPFVLICRLC